VRWPTTAIDAGGAIRQRSAGRKLEHWGVYLLGVDNALLRVPMSEDGAAALGAQAGEARLAGVFAKAGFSEFRKAKATPFNLILEAKP
jgi:hypothetical protein